MPDSAMVPSTGTRPDPDPTERTIDSLRREIGALRELIETRLDGADKAVKLLQEATDRVPHHMREAVQRLQELHEARFVALRELMDAKFEGNKTALDAALKTQKEASDKIEANFTKQFDNVQEIIRTTTKASDEKIDDLKGRLTAIESRATGVTIQKQETGQTWGYIVGAIGVVIAISSLLATVLARAG